MAQRTVLMDTSFVVAIENADDPHHERAKQLDVELNDEGANFRAGPGMMLRALGKMELNRTVTLSKPPSPSIKQK